MQNLRHRNATFLRRFVRFVACLMVLTLFPGCGGSGSSDGGLQGPLPSGLIGVAGGNLTSADGKVTLVIPPNAVNGDTQFTIDPANGFAPSSRVVGTVYEIGPTGVSFPAGAHAQLTITYGTLPAGVDPTTVTIGTMENGHWVDVPGSAGNQAVTAPLAHLSPYAVLQPAENPPPANQNPIASAGGPYFGQNGQPVTFRANGSVDPNNDPLTYTWNFGDTSPSVSVTTLTTTHAYTTVGDFTVTLTVSDGHGGSDTDQTTATITDLPPPNSPPVADAGGPYVATVGQTIPFSAAGSFDPDGDPLTYVWDFGDGGSAIEMTPSYAYSSDRTWPVKVTVSDSFGAFAEGFTTAEISPLPPINTPPVISGATIPSAGLVNETLGFDALATDSDGNALTYSWTFGDGSSSPATLTSATAHHYAAAGTFAVTVTVDDGYGGQAVATGTVTVTAPSQPIAFSQHYEIPLPQEQEPVYYSLYAITLSGSGAPPLRFNIVSYPAHQRLVAPGVPAPMDMVLNSYYQWWDSVTSGWRVLCRTTPDATCRASTPSHVDLTNGLLVDPRTQQPIEIPSSLIPPLTPTVIYIPQKCTVWLEAPPQVDFFTFTVTDATGATSDPATVTITVTPAVCKGRVNT